MALSRLFARDFADDFFRDPLWDFEREVREDPFGLIRPDVAGSTSMMSGNRDWLATFVHVPKMDVVTERDKHIVLMDLPGVTDKDIKVEMHADSRGRGNIVTVSGERKYEHQEENKDNGYSLVRRGYGRFSRSFPIPNDCDSERMDAKLENGVLRLTIPRNKNGPKKVKTIPVKM